MRLVRKMRSTAYEAAARLAVFMVGHAHFIGEMSIADPSAAAKVSPRTVTRFTKLLGFNKFFQLRFAFAPGSRRAVEAD